MSSWLASAPIIYEASVPFAKIEVVETKDVEAPEPVAVVPTEIAMAKVDPIACSCVLYIKSRGVKVGGDAKWFVNFPKKAPTVGGIVLLKYKEVHHVAYIEALDEKGIHIAEANFKHCSYSKRVIDWHDPHIVQFWTDK